MIYREYFHALTNVFFSLFFFSFCNAIKLRGKKATPKRTEKKKQMMMKREEKNGKKSRSIRSVLMNDYFNETVSFCLSFTSIRFLLLSFFSFFFTFSFWFDYYVIIVNVCWCFIRFVIIDVMRNCNKMKFTSMCLCECGNMSVRMKPWSTLTPFYHKKIVSFVLSVRLYVFILSKVVHKFLFSSLKSQKTFCPSSIKMLLLAVHIRSKGPNRQCK